MPIEDVFSIKGRGTVGTGRIERGMCKVGDTVEIVGLRPNKTTVVTGIEAFNKTLDNGQAARTSACCSAASKGRPRARPGAVRPEVDHAAHEVRGRGLRADQGRGRASHPVLHRVPPAVLLPHDRRDRRRPSCSAGAEMVMPGDNVTMEIELQAPIAMEEKLRFAVREGGKTVGLGRRDEDPGLSRRSQ
jgi:elongation factor Tu